MTKPSVLGVDLGGTKIAVCRMTRDGERSEVLRSPSQIRAPKNELIENLLSAVENYLNNCGGEPPLCIGYGLKDYVDNEKGIWMASPSTPDFTPVPLAALTMERFGIPAVLDNDVHVATLAEQYYGQGRTYKNFVYLNVGTGIAMGAVNEGRLMRGAINYAGEIGHMSVETEGEVCGFCGQNGCLEEIAGGGAIISYARRELGNWPGSTLCGLEASGSLHSAAIFREADNGDPFAVHIARRTLRAMLVACSAIVNIFNPEAIIFGGGVMADGWLIRHIREELPQRAIHTSLSALKELSLSALGSDHVGVMGAAALGWEYMDRR